jgi:hypothetical protein
MIAESLLIIVLLSYGACKPRVDGNSNPSQSCDLEAFVWDDSGNLPVVGVPLYQDSDYLSGCVSSICNYRSTFKLNHIQCSNTGIRKNALNFLSTRLIL